MYICTVNSDTKRLIITIMSNEKQSVKSQVNNEIGNEIGIENLQNEIIELKAQLEAKQQSVDRFNEWWTAECNKTKWYKEQLQALQTLISGILDR